jgi:hypothetical protein
VFAAWSCEGEKCVQMVERSMQTELLIIAGERLNSLLSFEAILYSQHLKMFSTLLAWVTLLSLMSLSLQRSSHVETLV